MTELEKENKIKELKEEMYKKADELEKEYNKNKKPNNITLDNGKTRYTDLFDEYKKKIEDIKNS